METLAPGVYIDDDGELHLDLAELLEANGFEDNEPNRAAVVRAAVQQLAAIGTTLVIIEHPHGIPKEKMN